VSRLHYKIEKEAPPPRRGKFAHVLHKLEPGDAVTLPYGSRGGVNATCARLWGRGNYAVHQVKGGFRIWRLR
jgi:hypothetical protein